jgi:hypothetical protein
VSGKTRYVLTKYDIRGTWEKTFDHLGEKFSASHSEEEIMLRSHTLKNLNETVMEQYEKPMIGAQIIVAEESKKDLVNEDEVDEDSVTGEEEMVLANQKNLVGDLYTALEKAKDDSGADMVSVNILVGDEAITVTIENTGYKNSEDIPMMGNQEGEKK